MSWYLTTNQINRLQIELTNYCNADCFLCDRHETNKNLLNNSFISFDKIKSIISNDSWNILDQIHFCGNYDEPTIHPDFIDICDWLLKNTSDRVEIRIATNGGSRDETFWKNLANLNKNVERWRLKVVWGIDGLEDTNHIYRKNVNWKILERNFQTYINNGGYAVWQFIGFEHNIHQFEKIQQSYKQWGFEQLKVINTFRVNEIENYRNNDVVPFDMSKVTIDKKNTQELKKEDTTLERIECKAIDLQSTLGQSLYINHKGVVTPCCWMGSLSKLKQIENLYKDYNSDVHNINFHDSMTSVLESSFFDFLKNSIQNQTNPVCKNYCTVKGKKSSKDMYIKD
jgi:hypothetical protein